VSRDRLFYNKNYPPENIRNLQITRTKEK